MSVAYEVKDSGILSDVYQDMASVLAEKKNYKESLWYSYQSCKLDNADQSSKMLNLAWSYLNADSIKQCNALLNTIQTEKLSELYTAYYIRHLANTNRKSLRVIHSLLYTTFSCDKGARLF